jgi:hypothetical protein
MKRDGLADGCIVALLRAPRKEAAARMGRLKTEETRSRQQFLFFLPLKWRIGNGR